jgi:hypothetical protein
VPVAVIGQDVCGCRWTPHREPRTELDASRAGLSLYRGLLPLPQLYSPLWSPGPENVGQTPGMDCCPPAI